MSQRTLFVILSAVLFAACEDDTADTIVSLNAVKFTKSHLRDSAESARYAAYQTDILAARLAGFTDSAAVCADSAVAFADSARVASVLLAAADHDFRVVDRTAGSFFIYNADEAKVIEKAGDALSATSLDYEAPKAYEVARRKAFAAYVAAGAAYDARNARLASRTYEVARRTADQTAATARRAADQAATAASRQVAAAVVVRRAAAAADSLQVIAEALPVEVTAQADNDKVARLRRAHDKNAAAQAAAHLASAVADSLQAAAEAVQTAAASRRAAAKATKAAKVYVAESARLRRAYNKDAVQAAYDVAYSTA